MVILFTRNVKKGLIQEDFKITLKQASAVRIFIHCPVLPAEGTRIMMVEGFSSCQATKSYKAMFFQGSLRFCLFFNGKDTVSCWFCNFSL